LHSREPDDTGERIDLERILLPRDRAKGCKLKADRIAELPFSENPHGIEAKRIYDSDHALASHIALKPGERLLLHVTPVDVFFYVLEGEGIVQVGDEKLTVSRDTVIHSPRDVPHCWYNESGGLLRVLVVKVPRPTSKTRLL
jgi:mannose-6-phosphate isomerase-like protein (cupin superfamily)